MSFRKTLLSVVLICFTSCCWAIAQDVDDKTKQTDEKKSGIVSAEDVKKAAADADKPKLRNEIEPGVVVYGRPHRFAEVGAANSFDSSPDGRTLVFPGSKIKFFDLEDNKVTDEIGEDGEHYQSVVYSPDGRYVMANTQGRKGAMVRVFDAIDKSPAGVISCKKPDEERTSFYLQGISVSPDATYVAMWSHNQMQVREVETGDLVHEFKDLGYIQGASFSADEEHLYFPKSNQVVVVDLKTGKELTKADSKLVGQFGQAIAVNLARNLVAIPGQSISIYDAQENKLIANIPLPRMAYAQSVAFSDDGSLVAAGAWLQERGGNAMHAFIIDIDRKKVLRKVRIASQAQLQCRFSVDNSRLYVAGYGIFGAQEIRLDIEDELVDSKYPVGPAQHGAIHPDGKAFLTCTSGGEITWIEAESGDVIEKIQSANTHSVGFAKDGGEVTVVGKWGSDAIGRYDFETGKRIKGYNPKTVVKNAGLIGQFRKFMLGNDDGGNATVHRQDYGLDAKFSKSETQINVLGLSMVYSYESNGITGEYTSEQSYELIVTKLDAESGKKIASAKFDGKDFGFKKNEWIQMVSIHPEGSQFAVARQNNLYLVNAETGETFAELQLGKSGHMSAVSYSPSGKFLVASSHEGTWIWDTESGDEVQKIERNRGTLFSFSKDDRRLAIGQTGQSTEIEVLDTKSWKKVFGRDKTEAGRSSVSLSDDGSKLLIGLSDCRMELWDLAAIK